jgi:hypothetical protein
MDFLTRSPSDILRYIVSFLLYNPDTARLSRVNRAMDQTPRLYPASAHPEHHGTTLFHFGTKDSFKTGQLVRSQDGRRCFPQTLYLPGQDEMIQLSKSGSDILMTKFDLKGQLKMQQCTYQNFDTRWSYMCDPSGKPMFYCNSKVRIFRNEGGIYVYVNKDRYHFDAKEELTQIDIISENNPLASGRYGSDGSIITRQGKRRKLTTEEQMKLPQLFEFDELGLFTSSSA